MPKQSFEIRGIRGGLVSNASSVDMPKESVAYLMNVDPSVEYGKIGAFPEDVEFRAGANQLIKTDMFKFVDISGTRYMIYRNVTDTLLHYIPYSTGLEQTFTPAMPIPTYLEQVGETIRATTASYPVFVGKINHDQFDVDPGTMTATDARLTSLNYAEPSGSTGVALYKAVRDAAGTVTGTKAYVGIQYEGDRVYILNQDGTILYNSSNDITFVSTLAICVEPKHGIIAVYDDDGIGYGKITFMVISVISPGVYKLLVKDETRVGYSGANSFILANWGKNGQYVTDMEFTIDPIADDDGSITNLFVWFALFDFSKSGKLKIDSKYRSIPSEVEDTDTLHGYPTFLWRSAYSIDPDDINSGTLNANLGVVNCSPILDACYDNDNASNTWRHGRLYASDAGEHASNFFWMEQFMRPLHNSNYGVGNESVIFTEYIGYLCNFYRDEEADIGPQVVLKNDTGFDGYTICNIEGVCSLFCHPTYAFTNIDGQRYFPFGYERGWALGNGTNASRFNGRRVTGGIENYRAGYIGPYNCSIGSLYNSSNACRTKILLISGKLYLFGGSGLGAEEAVEAFVEVGKSAIWHPSDLGVRHLTTPGNPNIELSYMTGGYIFIISSTHPSDTTKWLKVVYRSGSNATVKCTLTDVTWSISNTSVNTAGYAVITVEGSANIDAPGHRQGDVYNYYVALEYDGNQISPLSTSLGELPVQTKDQGAFIRLYVLKTDPGFNDRVTALRLFKTQFGGVTGQYESIPREINRVDITNFAPTGRIEGGAVDYYIYNLKDNNQQGATFQDVAGFPHTSEVTTPYYNVCHWDGYNMYIGDCSGIDDVEAKNMVYKSLPGRPDQFDVFGMFAKISHTPKAIGSIGGHLFVFTDSGGYTIDKQSFSVLGFDERLSAISPKHVKRTPLGLILANKQGLYINAGSGWMDVSSKIMRSSVKTSDDVYLSWEKIVLNSADDCCIGYDPKREMAIVRIKTTRISSPSSYYYYALCINHEMDIFPVYFSLGGNSGYPVWFENAPSTRDCIMAFSTASSQYMKTFATSVANYRRFTVESQKIDFGDGYTNKMFYKSFMVINNFFGERVIVKSDYGDEMLHTGQELSGQRVSFPLDSTFWEQRAVSLLVENIAQGKKIDSFGIIYRIFENAR